MEADDDDKIRFRRRLIATVLGLICVLTLSSLYGSFVIAPAERADLREATEKIEREELARAKFQAGATALFCTAQNRHDAIERQIIEALLPGAEARDAESGTDLVAGLSEALESIPDPTDCGELICQLFREVDEADAEITIQDPFGPNRKLAPCGEVSTAES